MSFRVGQDVYIGWVPDRLCCGGARKHRCSIGTITDGPFAPLVQVPSFNFITNDIGWVVAVNGRRALAAQRILHPIDDDNSMRCSGRKVSVPLKAEPFLAGTSRRRAIKKPAVCLATVRPVLREALSQRIEFYHGVSMQSLPVTPE